MRFKPHCPKCHSLNVDCTKEKRLSWAERVEDLVLHCLTCGKVVYGTEAVTKVLTEQQAQWKANLPNEKHIEVTEPEAIEQEVMEPELEESTASEVSLPGVALICAYCGKTFFRRRPRSHKGQIDVYCSVSHARSAMAARNSRRLKSGEELESTQVAVS